MSWDFLLSSRSLLILSVVAVAAAIDLTRRFRFHRPTHLLFACAIGSFLALGFIQSAQMLSNPALSMNSYLMALAIIFFAVGWKLLFGHWEVETKVWILASFLAWLALNFLLQETLERRYLFILAALTALIPTLIWCTLFLRYHRERLSAVLLLFLGGMLSTVPILFYDSLVRHSVELEFFVFKVVPQSFNQTSQNFVNGTFGSVPIDAGIIGAFVSFILVGLIEEGSKAWVTRRNGVPLATSIDDVMQFAILTAIGFAFAENVINPSYFVSFVQSALVAPTVPDLVGFLGGAAGRSVLTSMVHITSTGVMGYYLGLATFAPSYLAEREQAGHGGGVWAFIEMTFGIDRVAVFRAVMLTFGLLAAVMLHAAFNFIVTLPDLLPNHPQTFADLLGGRLGPFGAIPLLLFPSLLYVVGGFWLLTGLFLRRENQEERPLVEPPLRLRVSA